MVYSNTFSSYNSEYGINHQTKYTSSQSSFTIRCTPQGLKLRFLSAPLSGDILIYIDGQLVRDLTVPQSDYRLYEVDLSEYDSDVESEIVVVNQANTVYASGSSYGQNGRLYFAGYENYVISDEVTFSSYLSSLGIMILAVIVVSGFLVLLFRR